MLLMHFIFYTLCLAVTILADNTWEACGTEPWLVEPIPLLIIQNVQDIWLRPYIPVWRRRDIRKCFAILLDHFMCLCLSFFAVFNRCASPRVFVFNCIVNRSRFVWRRTRTLSVIVWEWVCTSSRAFLRFSIFLLLVALLPHWGSSSLPISEILSGEVPLASPFHYLGGLLPDASVPFPVRVVRRTMLSSFPITPRVLWLPLQSFGFPHAASYPIFLFCAIVRCYLRLELIL